MNTEKELINIQELTDSKELMLKKAPSFMLWFIWLLIIMVGGFIVWSYYGRIDGYVTAMGEIRPVGSVSSITVTSGGKIKKINVENGQLVKAGDILFELDSNYMNEQKKGLEKQQADKEKEIENYRKLISSLETGENLLSKETESKWYYQYENVVIDLQTTQKEIERGNQEVYLTEQDINNVISQAQKSEAESIRLHNEYADLYNAIANDEQYVGENRTLQVIFDNYQTAKEKGQIIYENSENEYKRVTDSDTATTEQIEQAKAARDSACADVEQIKTNALLEISRVIDSLNQNAVEAENTVENNVIKKSGISYNDTTEMAVNKLKNNYYIEWNQSIDAIEKEIQDIQNQIAELEESIQQATIKAQREGVFVAAKKYAVGDVISSGEMIATVVPKDAEYLVDVYIPEAVIAQIEKGQKVEYRFDTISSTDFEKVYGKITKVSADSSTDQETGQKYYQAEATIDKVKLSSKEGESLILQMGMQTEVHAITGNQRILSWVLDKLNWR